MPSIFSYAGFKNTHTSEGFTKHIEGECLRARVYVPEMIAVCKCLRFAPSKGFPIQHVQQELRLSQWVAKKHLNKGEEQGLIWCSEKGKSNQLKYYKLTEKGLDYVKNSE